MSLASSRRSPGPPSRPGPHPDHRVQDRVQVPGPDIDWPALVPLMILGVGGAAAAHHHVVPRKTALRGVFAAATVVIAVAAAIGRPAALGAGAGLGPSSWWSIDPEAAPGRSARSAACRGRRRLLALRHHRDLRRGRIWPRSSPTATCVARTSRAPSSTCCCCCSAAGGVVMAMANDLIVLFLGLETLSIAVYVLAAMHLRRVQSQEAGIKYFVLGAFSSAFFLYGIALVYGATGSTNLVDDQDVPGARTSRPRTACCSSASRCCWSASAFKVAAVPFHSWSPDVYDGAPTPVVAYMAAAVKAAGVRRDAPGLRAHASRATQTDWKPLVYAPRGPRRWSVGAALAVVQTNVKRMLAYSSISHAGFILVAVAGGARPRHRGGALLPGRLHLHGRRQRSACVTLVGRTGDDAPFVWPTTGVWAAPNPVLALAFTVLLLAQAGVPFTTGFFAKFYRDRRRRRRQLVLAGHRRHGLRGDRRVPLPPHHRAPCTCGRRRRRRRPGADQGRRIPVPRGAGRASRSASLVTLVGAWSPASCSTPPRTASPTLVQRLPVERLRPPRPGPAPARPVAGTGHL